MTARDERGAVTLTMLAVLALGVIAAMAAARAGAAAIGSARADNAADAAALAAADMLALGRGDGDARRAAAATAQSNGARLTMCACGGRVATVRVVVAVPVIGRVATSVARAEVRARAP